MVYDSSVGKSKFWGQDSMSESLYGPPQQQGFNQLYGQPPQVIVMGGFEGGRQGRRPSGRKKVIAYGIVAGVAALGVWKHQTIEDKIDTFKDNRHEKCMPSSAKLKDETFEVCFKPSSLYERGDGTIGALAILKTIKSENATPDTLATGSSAPNSSQADKKGPLFYDIVSSLCSIGTDKGVAELDHARQLIINNAKDLSGKVKHIPTDPAQIIITSEFQGQNPGDSPAIVSCP